MQSQAQVAEKRIEVVELLGMEKTCSTEIQKPGVADFLCWKVLSSLVWPIK